MKTFFKDNNYITRFDLHTLSFNNYYNYYFIFIIFRMFMVIKLVIRFLLIYGDGRGLKN